MKTVKIARVALQDNVRAQNTLMIANQRKQNLSGWLEQANAFYSNLLDDEALIAEMTPYGYDAVKLRSEFDLVESVQQKNAKHKKETGGAQEATDSRDKKMDELDKWLSNFRSIVKVAFDETPQKLERLGIMALNAPRAKKKDASASTSTSASA